MVLLNGKGPWPICLAFGVKVGVWSIVLSGGEVSCG
jgi:hypothetical protein